MNFSKATKFLIILILVTTSNGDLSSQSLPTIQLVESVPIETELGLDETERTLPIWLDMIKNAQSSIEVECFYVSNKPGEPLDEVLSAIKKAANRGIKVRFLIDAN